MQKGIQSERVNLGEKCREKPETGYKVAIKSVSKCALTR